MYIRSPMRANKMTEDGQDKLYRHLTRSTRDEVYAAVLEYKQSLSKRSEMYEPKFRRLLKEHGWTLLEYSRLARINK
jgi:hypothetical protein